jgi:hypothetical protein
MNNPKVYPGGPRAADSAARAAAEYERAVVAMLDSVTQAARQQNRRPPSAPAATPLAPAPAPAVRMPTAVSTSQGPTNPPRTPAASGRAPVTLATREPARPAPSAPAPTNTSSNAASSTPPRTPANVVQRDDPIVAAAEAAFSQPGRGVTSAAPAVPRPAPVVTAPVAAPRALPASALTGSAPVLETPTAAEVRAQASRIATKQRMASTFGDFLANSDDFSVSMVGGPTVTENTPGRARARFDVRITKFDAAGRRTSRLTTVSLDVTKQNGAVGTSAVSLGALREP